MRPPPVTLNLLTQLLTMLLGELTRSRLAQQGQPVEVGRRHCRREGRRGRAPALRHLQQRVLEMVRRVPLFYGRGRCKMPVD